MNKTICANCKYHVCVADGSDRCSENGDIDIVTGEPTDICSDMNDGNCKEFVPK